jgi:hypothetical protein
VREKYAVQEPYRSAAARPRALQAEDRRPEPREFVLTRNRAFDIPGIEPGRTDKITGVVRGSVPRMTQDVIDGRLDFMTERVSADPATGGEGEVRRPVSRGSHSAQRLLLLHERADEAVRQPRSAGGRQLRARQPGASAHLRRTVEAHVQLPAARVPGYKPNERWPFGDPDGPGDVEKASRSSTGPATRA